MNRLVGDSHEGNINPKYVEAARRLVARYPYNDDCTTDVEEDVWSDGPLIPQSATAPWGVGLLSQHIEEVRTFVVSTCNELGLVVYDWSESKVYRPDGSVVLPTRAPAKIRKPWWRFW